MKNVLVVIAALFAGVWVMKACESPMRRGGRVTQNITIASQAAADGLDLKALAEIVKSARSAEALEKELNREGGVNNLDLNADGKVDFIKVTEYGNKSDAWGFSLTAEPAEGQEQEIATVEIVKEGQNANVEVRGNEQIYGHNQHYHYSSPLTSFLLWSYLMRPHPFYMSPWGWGYYPSYYGSYRPVARSAYTTRTRNLTRASSVSAGRSSAVGKRASALRSPNAGKTASSGIRKSLRNPTSSQKAFAARTANRGARSGGFGRRSTGARSRSGGFGRTRSTSSGRRFSSHRGFSSRSFGGFGK